MRYALIGIALASLLALVPRTSTPKLTDGDAVVFLTDDQQTGCVLVEFTAHDPIKFMYVAVQTTTTGSNPPTIYPFAQELDPWNADCCPFFSCIWYSDEGDGLYWVYAWGHCSTTSCDGTHTLAAVEFDKGGTVEIVNGEIGAEPATFSMDAATCNLFVPDGIGDKVTVTDDPNHSCDPSS